MMAMGKSTAICSTVFSLYIVNPVTEQPSLFPLQAKLYDTLCASQQALLSAKGEERGKGGESSSLFFLQLAFTVS